MTDTQLVEQFRDGDIQAFNKLVERWQYRIHRVAYRYFASHDQAKDITQRTFIRAYKKLNSLEDAEKFSSWLYRIANNLCLDEANRAGRRRSESLESIQGDLLSKSIAFDPERSLQTNELGEVLQEALNRLPGEQRIVVILKEYEGLKFREIADILEEPENTIKSRMYYGLKKLKKIFDQWNINKEAFDYES